MSGLCRIVPLAPKDFALIFAGIFHGKEGRSCGVVYALTCRSHGVDLITFATLKSTGSALWSTILAEQPGRDLIWSAELDRQ